jgi:hypothetical protein
MRILARSAFWCFALLVFVSTHWPNLNVSSERIPRVDLAIHSPTFGMWALLLIGAGYFARGARGPIAESRGLRGWLAIVMTPRNVLRSGFVAIAYAIFDESTQAIPGLGRTAAWDDLAANAAGIVVVIVVSLVLGRVLAPLLGGRRKESGVDA